MYPVHSHHLIHKLDRPRSGNKCEHRPITELKAKKPVGEPSHRSPAANGRARHDEISVEQIVNRVGSRWKRGEHTVLARAHFVDKLRSMAGYGTVGAGIQEIHLF